MPFKEGVTDDAVHGFRKVASYANDLSTRIDAGELTPDEALQRLFDLISTKEEKKTTTPIKKK